MNTNTDKAFLDNYAGVDIYVGTQDGKFYATIKGVQHKKTKLMELKNLINQASEKPVKVLVATSTPNYAVPNTILSLLDKPAREARSTETVFYKTEEGYAIDNPPLHDQTEPHLFFYDQAIHQRLKLLLSQKFAFERDLETRWKEILKELVFVTPDELRARQAEEPARSDQEGQ